MYLYLGKHIIEISSDGSVFYGRKTLISYDRKTLSRYSLYPYSKKSTFYHSGIIIFGAEIKIYKDFKDTIVVKSA